MNKLVKLSIAVLVGAAIIAWYDPSLLTGNTNPFVKYHHVFAKLTFLNPVLEYFGIHHAKRSSSSASKAAAASEPVTEGPKVTNEPTRVFTKEELAKYKGEEEGGKIYMAIMGKVFDVTRGKDYYGPGGGYAFFSGKLLTFYNKNKIKSHISLNNMFFVKALMDREPSSLALSHRKASSMILKDWKSLTTLV